MVYLYKSPQKPSLFLYICKYPNFSRELVHYPIGIVAVLVDFPLAFY